MKAAIEWSYLVCFRDEASISSGRINIFTLMYNNSNNIFRVNGAALRLMVLDSVMNTIHICFV